MNATHVPTLHDKALLAYIRVNGWSARKLDRKSTDKVTSDNNAHADAARVNKHLLAGADTSLKNILSIGEKARKYLESNTMPWDDAGNRLLPNAKSMEVIIRLEDFKREFAAAVDEFVRDYPVLRAQAIHALGDLAASEDYPAPDIVRTKFAMRVSLTPLPTGFDDVRIGLAPAQVELLQKQYEARVKAQFGTALASVWERLRADVTAISEKLALKDDGERKIYRDSLIDNARVTCELLKELNVFEDPDLEDARFRVEQYICVYDADQLRKSPPLANAAKAEADAVLARMKEILGE